jgi:hypothetical protein
MRLSAGSSYSLKIKVLFYYSKTSSRSGYFLVRMQGLHKTVGAEKKAHHQKIKSRIHFKAKRKWKGRSYYTADM